MGRERSHTNGKAPLPSALGSSGFTLPEVMVGVVLLGSLALLSGYFATSLKSLSSRDRGLNARCEAHARAVLQELNATGFSGPAFYFGNSLAPSYVPDVFSAGPQSLTGGTGRYHELVGPSGIFGAGGVGPLIRPLVLPNPRTPPGTCGFCPEELTNFNQVRRSPVNLVEALYNQRSPQICQDAIDLPNLTGRASSVALSLTRTSTDGKARNLSSRVRIRPFDAQTGEPLIGNPDTGNLTCGDLNGSVSPLVSTPLGRQPTKRVSNYFAAPGSEFPASANNNLVHPLGPAHIASNHPHTSANGAGSFVYHPFRHRRAMGLVMGGSERPQAIYGANRSIPHIGYEVMVVNEIVEEGRVISTCSASQNFQYQREMSMPMSTGNSLRVFISRNTSVTDNIGASTSDALRRPFNAGSNEVEITIETTEAVKTGSRLYCRDRSVIPAEPPRVLCFGPDPAGLQRRDPTGQPLRNEYRPLPSWPNGTAAGQPLAGYRGTIRRQLNHDDNRAHGSEGGSHNSASDPTTKWVPCERTKLCGLDSINRLDESNLTSRRPRWRLQFRDLPPDCMMDLDVVLVDAAGNFQYASYGNGSQRAPVPASLAPVPGSGRTREVARKTCGSWCPVTPDQRPLFSYYGPGPITAPYFPSGYWQQGGCCVSGPAFVPPGPSLFGYTPGEAAAAAQAVAANLMSGVGLCHPGLPAPGAVPMSVTPALNDPPEFYPAPILAGSGQVNCPSAAVVMDNTGTYHSACSYMSNIGPSSDPIPPLDPPPPPAPSPEP